MNLNRLLALFILMIGYAGSMFAATDFTARPQLTTDESNPVVYAIVNYRGDIYSEPGVSLMSALQADQFGEPSIMTSEIDRRAMWYFTDAGDGGVYIHNLEYSNSAINGITAILDNPESCSPYYILDNEWSNGKGLVISISSEIDYGSCLDAANNAPILSEGGYQPLKYDWEGTCWFFVRVDPDDLNASQAVCESAYTENHPVKFTYQGLNFEINDSESCTLTGLVDKSMTKLDIPEVAIDVDGTQYKVTAIADAAFSYWSRATGNLIIPNSVKYIGEQAFSHCSGFTGKLVIPNSVKSIGERAFEYCSGFTGDLVISNSVKSIENHTFVRCTGFDGTLTLGSDLENIKEGAFDDCSGFKGNLIIPNSVKYIELYAFHGCSGFTGDLVLSNSITAIGDCAFGGCSGFTGDLVLPNSITAIGSSAFEGCSGFTGDLVLSNSITAIGSSAFGSCSGFTGDLVIPNSVKSIGLWAFIGCSNFTSKSCLAVEPPTLGDEAFDEGSTIYVLPGSLDKYKADEQWAKYILEVDQSGIESISDGNAIKVNGRSIDAPDGSRVFNMTGIEVGDHNLATGAYIVVAPDGRTKKVVIK